MQSPKRHRSNAGNLLLNENKTKLWAPCIVSQSSKRHHFVTAGGGDCRGSAPFSFHTHAKENSIFRTPFSATFSSVLFSCQTSIGLIFGEIIHLIVLRVRDGSTVVRKSRKIVKSNGVVDENYEDNGRKAPIEAYQQSRGHDFVTNGVNYGGETLGCGNWGGCLWSPIWVWSVK